MTSNIADLAPDRFDANSRSLFSRFDRHSVEGGYIVPGALHRRITLAAHPGRVPMAEHWVVSGIFKHNRHTNDFVSQPGDLLEHKAQFETWRTNRKYVREPIPDELWNAVADLSRSA